MQTAQTTKQQIIEGLDALSETDLEKTLAFMRALSQGPQRPQGIPAQEFIAFFQQFPPFTDDAREAMIQIMEEIEQEGKSGSSHR
jgi:hypothetical protein